MDKTQEIVILEAFREDIEKTTGIKAILEPQPVKLFEPHLRIMAPVGWEFRLDGLRDDKLGEAYTVALNALVTLNAYGDGIDVYLRECLSASFKVNLYFYHPVSIKLWDFSHAAGITAIGKRRPGGQHFRNEDEARGEKPYVYEEVFDVTIYYPYFKMVIK